MINIESRAHRILKPLSNYRDLSDDSVTPNAVPPDLNLGKFEKMVGIYSPENAGFSDVIVFTTRGLYLRHNGDWTKILYEEIDRTKAPLEKKDVRGLTIVCDDGREFWLPVNGLRTGGFYDAFEVLRFLDRVQSDLANAS